MLKAKKDVIGNLNKCYSLAKLEWKDQVYFACAAEKKGPAYLYDREGNLIEKLWDGPGGVMSMEQYPGKVLTLLATNKFYSPNDSAEASIVYYQKMKNGWKRELLCKVPFVHRFGVLKRNGINYLVVCTIKSSHAYKDDWSCPGRVWVSELPDDLSIYNEKHQLELTPLISGLYHNHGFCKEVENEIQIALIGTDNGIYKIVPPEKKGSEWVYEKILNIEASDMIYKDFDGDGNKELLVLSPFHGDSLNVYHFDDSKYDWVFRYPERLPFLHAICAGEFNGIQYAFIGNRKGNRNLFAIHYDKVTKKYIVDQIDGDAGAANCLYYNNKIIAANREKDEIALYTLREEL